MTTISTYAQHIERLQAGYERALESTGYASVVLHVGRGLLQRSVDDQYWPLKPNPSFAQWLPLVQRDALLVVRPGQQAQLIRPIRSSFWEGPAPVPGDHFWSSFALIECEPDAVASELPSGRLAWIGDATSVADALGIAAPDQNPPALVRELDALRVIKSAYEIECIAEANRIAALGHAHLIQRFRDEYLSELDLHLAFLQVTAQDSMDTPYGNIVAQGGNAAVLHHVHYAREIDRNESQSLLVDAGATYMGYASDITRTIVRGSGAAAADFAALIAGMEKLQVAVCAKVWPGRPYEELHNEAHSMLAELLLESGLCTGSASALVDEGVTRAFFPHGLGHSLGLQVHDVGCRLQPPAEKNRFLRNTSVIAPGQVFTIEPGCYFIDGLLGPLKDSPMTDNISWSTVDALRPFGGIRIEDNLVVTSESSMNLTRDNWPSQP